MGNIQELPFNTNIDKFIHFRNKKIIKKNIQYNSFLELNTKDSLSYNGVKTSYDDSENDANDKKIECNIPNLSIENVNSDFKNSRMSIIFEWKEPANTVYLTGSFANWNHRFIMRKINDKFELLLVKFINLILRNYPGVNMNINSLLTINGDIQYLIQLSVIEMETLIIS